MPELKELAPIGARRMSADKLSRWRRPLIYPGFWINRTTLPLEKQVGRNGLRRHLGFPSALAFFGDNPSCMGYVNLI
jgi:hypothetical protein